MKQSESTKKLKELIYQIDLQALKIPTILHNISSLKQIENIFKNNFHIVESLLIKKDDAMYPKLEKIGGQLKGEFRLSLTDINLVINHFQNALITSIHNNILQLDEIEILSIIQKAKVHIAKGYFRATLNENIAQLQKLFLHYENIFDIHLHFLFDIKKFLNKELNEIAFIDPLSCQFTLWLTTLEAQILLFSTKDFKYTLYSQLVISHKIVHYEANNIIAFIKEEEFERAVESLDNLFSQILLMQKILSDALTFYERDKVGNFIEFMLEKSYWEKDLLYYFIINLNISKFITIVKNGILERILRLLKEDFQKKGLDLFAFIYKKELHILIKREETFKNEDIDQIIEKNIHNISDKNPYSSLKEKIRIFAIRLDDLKNREPQYFKEMLHVLKRRKDKERFVIVSNGLLEEISNRVQENMQLTNQIIKKIKKEDIRLYAQKIVDQEGSIFALEILSRMKIDKEYIHADEFIKILENNELTEEFDLIVIKKIRNYYTHLSKITNRISVNVFPSSISSEIFLNELVESYKEAKKYGLELIIEITEHTIVENLEILEKLHEKEQIAFAIDDIGTGYSNFKTIIEFAQKGIISFVKIDGSLIEDIDKDERSRRVIKELIDLFNVMGLKPVVAEYVDNQSKIEILKALSPDILFQGYYFSIPTTIERLRDELQK